MPSAATATPGCHTAGSGDSRDNHRHGALWSDGGSQGSSEVTQLPVPEGVLASRARPNNPLMTRVKAASPSLIDQKPSRCNAFMARLLWVAMI